MTLIEVRNSDGVVGRCDARCYDAEGPECDCICGGKNHGAGQEKAMENVREEAERMIDEYAQRLRLEEYDGYVNTAAWQLPLLGEVAR